VLACQAPAQAVEKRLDLGDGRSLQYQVLDAASTLPSAQDAATRILRLLAAGNLEEAAVLSNAPKRRYEVLRDYLASVGEAEFKRVFGQYLSPANRVVAEIALERHRLIIWDLAEADHRLAGQYYVEVDGRFLMDDVPSETRAALQRILQSYRASRPSKRTD